MRFFRKTMSLLVGVALLVTLCAACGTGGEDTQAGRYVETDITPAGIGDGFHSFVLDDGTLVCYDSALTTRYESADGGVSWQESPGPGAAGDRYAALSNAALLEDGELLVFLSGQGLFRIGADGAETPVPIAEIDAMIAEGQFPMFTIFAALPDGRLLLSYMQGAFSISSGDRREGADGDPQSSADAQGEPSGGQPQERVTASLESAGEGPVGGGGFTAGAGGGSMNTVTALYDARTGSKIADFTDKNVSSAAAADGTLYLVDATGRVAAHRLDDGSAVAGETRTLPAGGDNMTGAGGMFRMMGEQSATLAAGADGTLYQLDESGLQAIDGSGAVTQLLDSSEYSIGGSGGNVQRVDRLPGGDFVIAAQSGMATKLYKYVWDAGASLDPDKAIKIWSLEEDDVVRAAINQFRAAHPDAIVRYEVALGDGNLSAEDAVKNLNTSLLNGDGPDIIILDGCPAESYANEGILLNLAAYLDLGDVYGEIQSAFGRNGGIWYLPTQFSLPVLLGSAENLAANATLEQLVQTAANGNDITPMTPGGTGDPFANLSEAERAAIGFGTFDEAFDLLWKTSAPAIVSESGIDSEALGAFLTALKTLSDKYDLTAETAGYAQGSIAFSAGGGRATQLNSGMTSYMMQRTLMGADTLNTMMFLQMLFNDGMVADTEFAAFPGLAQGAWIPSSIVGVNADSAVRDLAVEFAACMLSDAVQSASYGTGFPVTRQGVELQIAGINERLAENDQDPFIFDFDALVSLLETPSVSEQAVTDTVEEAALACCKGELTVEEALAKIEQNLKTYLAERA